jgi:SulP family sulfate permease
LIDAPWAGDTLYAPAFWNVAVTAHRYEPTEPVLPWLKLRVASALRDTLGAGYGLHQFRSDLGAGLVVGLVALPLSMALAIASGVPPQHGLYTAIVAGALAAALGGSRYNVTGPTAAFVVVLVPVTAKFGVGGLMLASLMAGLMLIAMGVMRLGRLIQFIPHPVTTGFTAGIAVVIATLQIKDFLGLDLAGQPEGFIDKLAAIALHLPSLHWPDAVMGGATLAVLLSWRRLTKAVPAPLVALTLAGLTAYLLPQLGLATIGTRFGGIPQVAPTPAWPWQFPGPDGQPLQLSLGLLRELALPAIAIAMLGAIESLLCAVIADGMAAVPGTRHNPDTELVGQGIGNIVAPFFGGFAATAAIARTAANIRSGGRSPVAAIVHALFILLAVLLLAPVLSYIPMASMAAMLLLVAWNMSEAKHFIHILRVAPRSDMLVLVACFVLTVTFDMVVAVCAGVLLAALLFMRRMAEFTHTRITGGERHGLIAPLPKDVVLYEIAGPLFFGAAERAMEAIHTLASRPRAVILHMGNVPVMDMTGLVALQSAIAAIHRKGTLVVLTGVQSQPAEVMARGGIRKDHDQIVFCDTIEHAEMLVRLLDPHAPDGPQGPDALIPPSALVR